LVDRKLHEQSINVTDPEARACWIGVGGAIFALGASSTTMLLERAIAVGKSTGASALTTLQGLNTGSLVFGAVGMANQVHSFGER
jgi:hypothetical protein